MIDPPAPDSAAPRIARLAAMPGPGVLLPWLVRLRWFAVAGQTITLVAVYFLLDAPLPYAWLGAVIATTAATNLILNLRDKFTDSDPAFLVPVLLSLDIVLLTCLLYLSGGPENPFSLLYAVHVAMAAVALSPLWIGWTAAFSSVCFAALSVWHQPLELPDRIFGLPVHLVGLWLAFSLVVVVIAYFVGRITLALNERQRQLTVVRSLASRNERLASLTTLAAGAAHELGTPLGTIALVARELERSAGREEIGSRLREDARLIRSQVNRCSEILDRMSAQVREGENRTRQRIHLEDLFDEMRSKLGSRGRFLDFDRPADLDSITTCSRDLVEALLPLLRNALDASEEEERVTLSVSRDNEMLRFTIRDRGRGMTPEELERAGEPFFTTKEPGRGTGLGLHLVRLLAERLGGRLELASQPGAGTTAHLEFRESEFSGDEYLRDPGERLD